MLVAGPVSKSAQMAFWVDCLMTRDTLASVFKSWQAANNHRIHGCQNSLISQKRTLFSCFSAIKQWEIEEARKRQAGIMPRRSFQDNYFRIWPINKLSVIFDKTRVQLCLEFLGMLLRTVYRMIIQIYQAVYAAIIASFWLLEKKGH